MGLLRPALYLPEPPENTHELGDQAVASAQHLLDYETRKLRIKTE